MTTQEEIEELKLEDNIFELAEDTEMVYLVHFYAPYTGAEKCIIPRGTAFAPHSQMRSDALYMHFIDGDKDDLLKRMREQVKIHHEDLYPRIQGFSFFITEDQLKTLPLTFRSGSAERILKIMHKHRNPIEIPKDIPVNLHEKERASEKKINRSSKLRYMLFLLICAIFLVLCLIAALYS